MADDDLTRILSEGNTAIEVYRAAIATPETFEELRFWLQNELRRIQNGFVSTDEVLKKLASLTGEGSEEGPAGPSGPTGPAGEAGRGIMVFQQEFDPGADALPGDIWFVEGYS